VADAGRRPCGAFEEGGAAIDGELGLAVQDDEHLLALIVKMRPNASAGREDAAMQEVEIGAELEFGRLRIARAEELHVVHGAGAVVHGRHVLELCGIRVRDALRDGSVRGLRRCSMPCQGKDCDWPDVLHH
jgi:hypothetical protein